MHVQYQQPLFLLVCKSVDCCSKMHLHVAVGNAEKRDKPPQLRSISRRFNSTSQIWSRHHFQEWHTCIKKPLRLCMHVTTRNESTSCPAESQRPSHPRGLTVTTALFLLNRTEYVWRPVWMATTSIDDRLVLQQERGIITFYTGASTGCAFWSKSECRDVFPLFVDGDC